MDGTINSESKIILTAIVFFQESQVQARLDSVLKCLINIIYIGLTQDGIFDHSSPSRCK